MKSKRFTTILSTAMVLMSMVACAIAVTSCKNENKLADFKSIQEYIGTKDDEYCKVDSISGYTTFSANNKVEIVPEEITKEQYERLLTDKHTVKPVAIDTNAPLYAGLYEKGLQNCMRYDLEQGFMEGDELLEERRGNLSQPKIPIYHYPETKQYVFVVYAPLTTLSSMMTEDGIVDTTYMQSETRTYGTNRIFVGQEGFDCDFHGSLWFYRYNQQQHRMITLCHFKDYRWSSEGVYLNLCWISNNELLVAAASNGSGREWVGGYTSVGLAPFGTPVFYKLTITTK